MCRLGPQVETSTGVVKHARADRSVEGLTVGDTIAVRDGRSEAVRIGTAGSRRQPAAASSPTAAGPEVRQNTLPTSIVEACASSIVGDEAQKGTAF